jgi:glutamate N-acetyltransferase/amino-acid N-acetyltransferase
MATPEFSVPGFDAVGIASGIKKDGALDLALVTSSSPCRAAALFTQNAFPAAPVQYDRQLLSFNPEGIYGVVINSGNANACTGAQGLANTRFTAEAVEAVLGTGDNAIFVMSTGVIGAQLQVEKLLDGVPKAHEQLNASGWSLAAQAIMTTDTRPKLAARSLEIDGVDVHIAGMAKGSGMIHPNMATMLSVIATDANVSQPLLQAALVQAANESFNCISIDGDTSTNDTLLLLANGAAAHDIITEQDSAAFAQLQTALTDLCTELAHEIVRDGEGATKFVTLQIEGAVDDAQARQAANTVATSPLVKTAFFGNDANWGRVLAAIGRADIEIDPDQYDMYIGCNGATLQLVAGGTPTDYAEADAAAIFAQPEFQISVELGLGNGSATVWTSDLSHDYVSINADYRT